MHPIAEDAAPAAEGIDLAALDVVGLVLVGLLLLLGLWRGLWWQVIRLAGVVVAVGLARAFGPGLAEPISRRWPEISERIANGISWIVIFLVAMGAATLLGILGNRLLEAMKLGLWNRVGGLVAGAITGGLIHVALVMAICQLTPETFVARYVSGTWSERIYERIGSRWRIVISDDAGRQVDNLLQRAPFLQMQDSPGASPEGDEPRGEVR